MSRNGSGVYSLPSGNPFVAGTVIDSTVMNTTMTDLGTALTGSISADGQTVITGNLQMSTYRHTGVGDGVSLTDYASLKQVQNSTAQWAGTATGTGDALVLTVSPVVTAYAAGQTFRFQASAASNTGAATVSVSGLAVKDIQNNGGALSAADITASKWYSITYDGTAFQLSKLALPPAASSISATNLPIVTFQQFGGI